MNWSSWLSKDTLAVFLFHGVVAESPWEVRNYTRKHLVADRFREFLKDITGFGNPVSMEAVSGFQSRGEPYPPYSFAVTFDDGFENNHSVAAPILREFRVPATFYVSTGLIQDNSASWIDRIEACLEESPSGAVELPWGEGRVAFADREGKIRLLNILRKRVKSDRNMDADAFADTLIRSLGAEPMTAGKSPLDLKMTWEQVRELHRDDLFIVGGHSHRHSILSFLPPGELEAEIDLSIDLLRKHAGIDSPHYSYPEGLQHCFDDRVIGVLRARGIRCCPSAITGVNMPVQAGNPSLNLPRPWTRSIPDIQGESGEFDLFHLRRVPVL